MNPTDIEKTNLESHVEMCALRYGELDRRLTSLEVSLEIIKKEVIDGKNSLAKVIITAAGTTIASILGLIATIFIKF